MDIESYDESVKKAELAQMKRLATGLLVFVTLVYISATWFEAQFTWLEFVSATAEAAMVGAIADWFAVTALFRHPMGLKIPHTAIVPRKKDVIANQFGHFVQENFLSEEIISEKVRSLNLSQNVAAWIIKPENSEQVAQQIAAGLAGLVRVMRDEEVQAMIEKNLENRIRDTEFSPILGRGLAYVVAGSRKQDLLDTAVNIGLYMLEENRDVIRSRIREETPWWFPKSVDRTIFRKIVDSTRTTLIEMQIDPEHPMRERFELMVEDFLDDLQYSEDILEKERDLKDELLMDTAVRDFVITLWQDLKETLIRHSEGPDTELRMNLQKAVAGFGESILHDEDLAAKINTYADDAARYLIRTYGHEVADLVSHTIESWDPEATSERIEVQIGRDLQFIRINGTVVGGLAGLTIHTVSVLPGYFL